MDVDRLDGPRPARRDRWTLATACVLLIVAGALGVWAVAGRDEPAPVSPPASTGRGNGTEFRLIAREPVGDPDRRGIFAAGSTAELEQLLAGYRDSFDRFAGDLDERNEVAVVVERLGNACPPDLERFTPVEDAWRLRWADPSPGDCEDVGLGWVYLVAVRRDALAGIGTFVLPAEEQGTLEWDELTVAVPSLAPTT